ncbi:UDP-glucose:glycoprotein glucosyltransferase [Marchantia polymorpha subsp. ruderalis]
MASLSDFQFLRGCRMTFAVVVLALLVLAMVAEGSTHQSKNVNVAVRAKWTGTSLLLEASELVAKEGDPQFWRFVEGWMRDAEPAELSDEECVHKIVKEGTEIVGSSLAPLFQFSLSLRSASPKIVLYRQLAQQSISEHFSMRANTNNDGLDKVDQWSVSENPIAPEGQCCWVEVGSHVLLGESELKKWLQFTQDRSHAEEDEVEVYDFDHVYPGSEGGLFVAILYGALGTSCFRTSHSLLSESSKMGHVKYIYRPVLPSNCASSVESCAQVGAGSTLYLGGYGVELALKNMEYKAIDDSEEKKGDDSDNSQAQAEDLSQEERKVEEDGEVMTFRDNLLSSEIVDKINVGELKDLGYLTVQRIIHSSEPLRLMQEINQNFPKLVSSLCRMQLNDTVKEEIANNQRRVPPGKNLFAINGALVNPDTLDIFSLLELVEGELSVAGKIDQVKVPPNYIRKLLRLTDPRESSAFRLDFRSEHVHYMNNIEEDSMYKRWRPNLNEILMPAYPGQMRYIRKNLYHAVYIIDPALPVELKLLETMTYYVQNSVPMRFGVIFMSSKKIKAIESHGGDIAATLETTGEEDVSELIIRLFHYFKENMDLQTAFGFLNLVNEELDGSGEVDEEPFQASVAENIFLDILREKGKSTGPTILQNLKEGNEFKEKALESSAFAYRLGLSPMHPCMLMNGLFYGPSQVQNAAIAAMNEEMPRIQEAVYYGRINARTDVLDKMLSEGGQPRYNPQIVSSRRDDRRYVSLSSPVAEEDKVLTRLQYLHHPGSEDDLKPLTHWICVDLTQKSGIHLLQQGLRYLMEGAEKGRIGVLHNLESRDFSGSYSLLIQVVTTVANSPSRRAKVVPFLQKLLGNEEFIGASLGDSDATLEKKYVKLVLDLADEMGLKRDYLEDALLEPVRKQAVLEQIHEERVFVARAVGLKAGAMAVVTNGRVYDQQEGSHFVAEDFALLDSVEYERRIKPVEEIIQEIEWTNVEPDELTSEFLSTKIMAVSSSMASRSRGGDSANFEMLRAEHSAIVREVDGAYIHVDAVIDPLSVTGQKLTPLLVLLEDWLKPSFRIVFNPMNAITDLPLKNFYRYVVPSKNVFSSDGVLSPGPVGVFTNLPPSRTLTMNLDVPESWLVEPVVAVHDLDNIVLEKLKNERTMSAVYELEALVATGHCYEKDGDPPRGLQLLLGTKLHSHLVDTIVMANLGYWQMKAAPGVWTLQLAPGRSTELYTLEGPGEGTDAGLITKRVVVQDLKGKLVRFEVVKRHGKEDQQMLEVNDAEEDFEEISPRRQEKKKEGKGFLKWASDFLVGGGHSGENRNVLNSVAGGGQSQLRRGETINIFSIASGHLYERFLKIMMLSVIKNTNRPVKFWFIKNYLSPQFKDVIPHMAKEYGFEYDLVTYKWPTWLHKQTEKQRIIWAYKILFLDVIFPLSLKKVIFVDADQIVRTDMGELYDMDIKGRPLAYTPFCDNNREMDGYRFWNQGFWKDHLRGRPYHISALYVVDLVKFRQSAAGDNLRVFYESLSKDPNSLSNLDQDLPNYAQHTVPIFSLPQQWLWCESWCGNGTKAQAKTIDLCNNPQTKEPKLEGARRIVAEWPALDEEARQLTARILGGKVTQHVSDQHIKKQVPQSLDSGVVEEESNFVDLESKSEL